MSWKTDIVLLGALGVGAYVVITHLGDISNWIAAQLGGAVAKTGVAAATAVLGGDTTQQQAAGATAGAGLTTGVPSLFGDLLGLANPASGAVGVASRNLVCLLAPGNPICAPPVGTGGGTTTPPKVVSVGNVSFTTSPDTLYVMTQGNPAQQAAVFASIAAKSVAPTGVQKIGLSAAERAEATALVSQPGYRISNAMLGSAAWSVAHGG